MFTEKSGNEKADAIKEKMKHALNAFDIITITEILKIVDDMPDEKEILKKEIQYCRQRIDIIKHQD